MFYKLLIHPVFVSLNVDIDQFSLPPFHSRALDTVAANSQVISVPTGNYQSFHSLITWAGNGAEAVNITFTFEDGSTDIAGLMLGSWWATNPFDGPIHTSVSRDIPFAFWKLILYKHRPYHIANASLDSNMTISYNATSIQYSTSRIANNKKLVSLTLPLANTKVRIFSISLLPANSSGVNKSLRVENVRSTTKWISSGMSNSSSRVQQMEVTIANVASLSAGVDSWITSRISVQLSSSSVNTVVLGTITRLRSNDQVIVIVGVTNNGGIPVGSDASVKVIVNDQNGIPMALLNGDVEWSVTAGIPQWESNDQSLATHEAPEWVSWKSVLDA
jgi:alpha-L-fucosidase